MDFNNNNDNNFNLEKFINIETKYNENKYSDDNLILDEDNKVTKKDKTKFICLDLCHKIYNLGYQISFQWLFNNNVKQMLVFILNFYNLFMQNENCEEMLGNIKDDFILLRININEIIENNRRTINIYKLQIYIYEIILKIFNYNKNNLTVLNTLSIYILRSLLLHRYTEIIEANPWII